jgi:DNA-binding MarR family transcriptional regulator
LAEPKESNSSRNMRTVSSQFDDDTRRSKIKMHLEQLLDLCDPTDANSLSSASINALSSQPTNENPLMLVDNDSWLSIKPDANSRDGITIDASLFRKIKRQRMLRNRFFGKHLFADPAWDMILDLAVAHSEGRSLCVSSLGYGSGVPATTSLRWISQLVKDDLVERVQDNKDKRRTFVRLSANGVACVIRFFAEVGRDASPLV